MSIHPELSQDLNEFVVRRLAYYQDVAPITNQELVRRVFPITFQKKPEQLGLLLQRQSALEHLRKLKPDIIIITATKNRPDRLIALYESLSKQQKFANWVWLVVDNNQTTDLTPMAVEKTDQRVIKVNFVEQTGCGYPVRNFGLDLVQLAYTNYGITPRVMMVDDDDALHNEFSLYEQYQLGQSATAKKIDVGLVHGITVMDAHFSPDRKTEVTEPHDISDSKFGVINLADVFDVAIISTAGCFPISFLTWLRYPPEPAYEDNGFNHKLLLNSRKRLHPWLGTKYPIIARGFDAAGMTAKCGEDQDENKPSNATNKADEKPEKIGLYAATGQNAQMVRRIKHLTDFFIRENL